MVNLGAAEAVSQGNPALLPKHTGAAAWPAQTAGGSHNARTLAPRVDRTSSRRL